MKKYYIFEKFNMACPAHAGLVLRNLRKYWTDMTGILLENIFLDGKAVDIYVDSGRIAGIFPAGEGREKAAAGTEIVGCTGKFILPGFVNMHTHAAMSLMRGLGEDMVFSDWIKKIWTAESYLDKDFVYWGTKVACLEMIKTGTVCFNDHYWFSPEGRRAAVEMGMAPAVSYVFLDRYDKKETVRQKEQFLEMYDASLKWKEDTPFVVGIHSIYSVSEELIVWASDFAKSHSMKLHIHLSETEKEVADCIASHGVSPVRYLDGLGVLNGDVIAAHTLWLSEEDVKILGDRKVNCVHNINSNLKLSSGYRFLYDELRDAGANICLGTDGCASSNNMDMLEAVKTSAIVQKAWRGNPAAMPLDELLAAATVNGARALGKNSGRIEPGADADFIIVNASSSFFLSPGPFLANLIYSAHSDCIESVVVGGRFVMRDRVVEGEEEILENARKVLRKIPVSGIV